MVYDITSERSFNEVTDWNEQIKQCCDDNIIKFLIGNKTDLESQRTISRKRGVEMANLLSLEHFSECSAKTKEGIDNFFETFYKMVYNKTKEKFKDHKKNNILLRKQIQKENECAC